MFVINIQGIVHIYLQAVCLFIHCKVVGLYPHYDLTKRCAVTGNIFPILFKQHMGGARPLRRTIQSLLEDKMAEEILDGKIKKSAGVEAGCEDGRLIFTVKKKAVARRKTAAPKALAKVSRQTQE